MKNNIINSQINLTYFGNYTAQILEVLGLYNSISGAYEHDNLRITIGLCGILADRLVNNYSKTVRSVLRKEQLVPVENLEINLEKIINN